MTTYLGFNIEDSMFRGTCLIRREELTQAEFCRILQLGVVSCLNRSHPATIRGLKVRLGVDVSVPPTPPRIQLQPGDSILLVTLRGLPRHTERYQYTDEEVARATFIFSRYTLIE